MRNVIQNLRAAIVDPQDYTARSNLTWDAVMAQNRILKLGKQTDFQCQQMVHQLAVYTNCNQGERLAVLHPAYYRHIYKNGCDKFKRFAVSVWGISEAGRSEEETACEGVEAVAGYIAAAANADTFALEPIEPYSSDNLDWTNENSRVSKEHENEDARNVELVSTTVNHWESYDTVFIGYPIWWHIAAWPVNGFVTANDFTGKTVIPFCTSSSSGLEESGKLLAEAAGTGNWLEGARFASNASEETVRE